MPDVQPKPRRQYKVKPTDKARTAVALVAQGEHPKDAMLAAGYSKKTASHWKENLLQSTGAQTVAEALQVKLADKGVTIDMVAEKIGQLMNAKKYTNSYTEPDRIVDDSPIQLKATELAMRAYSVFGEANNQTNIQMNFGELKNKYSK